MIKLKNTISYLPGLALLIGIAFVSTFISSFLPPYIGKVFIAVLIGIVINNTFKLKKERYDAGVKLGLKSILKFAIILLGAGVSFNEIADFGPHAVILIVILISFSFLMTALLGKVLNIPLRQRLLVSVGICICGNTAIATIAPILEAEEDEMSVAVGIVTLFGVVGVLVFPLIGHWLALTDSFFGYWSGTAINDTSQVVAAGFIYSEAAGEIATTVKLIRNIFIVPVIFLTSFFYWRTQKGSGRSIAYRRMFPVFILGFLLMALLNSFDILSFQISLGSFSGSFSKLLTTISKFLILLALSGMGLGVSIKKLRSIGIRPFILGFSVELLLAIASFTLIGFLGI